MNPQAEQLLSYWQEHGLLTDPRIAEAFRMTPREIFIQPEYKDRAYEDTALPTDFGQTISQPTTVIMMLEALKPSPDDNVLEVGTGSGYNAVLLSQLVSHIVSIERIYELANEAKTKLQQLHCENVEIITSDGRLGFPEKAPYDKIIVTAAAREIPPALTQQLKEGGILVIPVGGRTGQSLIRGTKKEGKVVEENLGPFIFVPLV